MARPGNPHWQLELPFPRFPIWLGTWPGNGEGVPDSRLGRNRELGNPPFPDSAGKRETGPRAIGRKLGNRGWPRASV